MTPIGRTYLVALQNAVFALDIKQMIAEFDPDASIIIAYHPADVLRIIQTGAYLAFMEPHFYPALTISASEVHTQIILVDECIVPSKPPVYARLAFPFSSSDVIALLQQIADKESPT